MKTSNITLEQDYVDFVNMTPKEISQWLNTLVEGLRQKMPTPDNRAQIRKRD